MHLELPIFKDNLITLHHVDFNQQTKKIQIDRVKVEWKRMLEDGITALDAKELEIDRDLGMNQTIGDMLKHSVHEQQGDNFKLKRRIAKLEETLKPKSLFTKPLSMKGPEEQLETLEKSTKAKGAQEMIHGVTKVIVGNIEYRMNLLLEFQDLINKSSILYGRIISLKELFKQEMKKDMDLYKSCVDNFLKKLIDTSDRMRKKGIFPSNNRIKQIKEGWDSQIDILQ